MSAPAHRRIPTATIEAAHVLASHGWTWVEIENALRCSQGALYKAGVRSIAANENGGLTPEQRQARDADIAARWRTVPTARLARDHRVSTTTIREIARRIGALPCNP